jgi:hypothetical protein
VACHWRLRFLPGWWATVDRNGFWLCPADDSNSDCANSDAHGFRDAYRHADERANPDTYAYGDPFRNAYGNVAGNADRRRNSHHHADAAGYRDAYSHTDSHSHAHPHA